MIDADDAVDGYQNLDVNASNWIETLRLHAIKRAREIPQEELDECIESFYEKLNAGRAEPLRVFKETMWQFADDYGYPRERWKEFQKLYNEYKRAELQNNAAPVVIDGKLPLAQLRRVLPSGTTAGQWYTHDRSFDPGGGGSYDYHLSVAFSLEPRRSDQPQMARITRIHASFKRGYEDRKYWYSVNAGTVTFSNHAGGATSPGAMRNRADGLLGQMLHRLNLQ